MGHRQRLETKQIGNGPARRVERQDRVPQGAQDAFVLAHVEAQRGLIGG